MDQFLDPETDTKHQFLDPETVRKCQFLVKKLLDPETDIMDQFLDPETDIKHQFLDPETDKKCQFLDGRPETDVMDQFLDPETDIMGEGNYILLWTHILIFPSMMYVRCYILIMSFMPKITYLKPVGSYFCNAYVRHGNNVVWFRRHKFRVFWVPQLAYAFTPAKLWLVASACEVSLFCDD